MFYRVNAKDHIRVPPDIFNLEVEDAVLSMVKKKYEGYISKDIGIVVDVSGIGEIGEGVIIPGDGAAYYDVAFDLLTFKPELQEILLGRIKDIADFGAFMTIGPIEGMIHVSQTMDDFVSFSKDKTLAGKETKKSLRIGDKCRARVIAVSYKDVMNPKIGLTMRQPSLGRLDWLEEEEKKKK
ncbi:MAG TPA: DNA-directed RNA polymerase [Candidatus Nanoarchaeia archaeon]|nr:DNA-directed RNA polymerase [Candidatus Nanoarchaeia archaeon]